MEYHHQRAHDTGRGVELPVSLSSCSANLDIGAIQNVLFTAVLDYPDVSEQVYHIPQPPLVRLGPGEILEEDVL